MAEAMGDHPARLRALSPDENRHPSGMPKTDSQTTIIDVPSYELEAAALAGGRTMVAGIDEAGRGALAGPVVAAAVVLDRNAIPEGLNDSKKLTEEKREELFEQIMASAQVGFCSASV